MNKLDWEIKSFTELTTERLFSLLKLRTDVFVVEQQCAYPEIDGNDNAPDTLHIMAVVEEKVVAYARAYRAIDDGNKLELTTGNTPENVMDVKSAQSGGELNPFRIGRVVVAEQYRKKGLARELMIRIEQYLLQLNPKTDHVLSAQETVLEFYESLGFVKESDVYLEDGIPHVDMRKRHV